MSVKIGDFGLAVGEQHHHQPATAPEEYALHKADMMRSFSFNVGTPLYQSPEQELNKPYNEKVDMYALGIILLEICGEFSTSHERDQALRALKLEKQLSSNVSELYKEESKMILELTADRAADRPDAREVLERLGAWEH